MRHKGLAALLLVGLSLMAWPACAGEMVGRSPESPANLVSAIWQRLCDAVAGFSMLSGQLGQVTAASEGGGTMDPDGQPRANGGGTMDPNG